jgi:hypothetical protein
MGRSQVQPLLARLDTGLFASIYLISDQIYLPQKKIIYSAGDRSVGNAPQLDYRVSLHTEICQWFERAEGYF